MTTTFLFLMIGLKIPIAMLLYLVWWAVHQTPETADSGDGGTPAPPPLHPRSPRPRRPRRGPHGEPSAPAPARTRSRPVRGRARSLGQR